VLILEGFKTPGEMVLLDEERRIAISGDAFWGDPAGSLRLMPDEKLADPARALLSSRRLRERNLLHLFVGDGAPAIGNADALLGAMLDARAADVCLDPDPKKSLVEQTSLIVRSEPELDYFDGE
jgi:glyoxylase-like metal-dependent hydrolase (beta-lactamase superfamily II)